MSDDRHLSFSQFKSASTCPAAWHAEKVAGTYIRPGSEAMALGTLLHVALQPPHDTTAVMANEAEWLCTGKGKPTAAAARVLASARYALTIPDVQTCLDGAECEASLTADLGGIEWLCRLDLLQREEGIIVDIKNAKEADGWEWFPPASRRVHWTEAALYWWQLALYREAYRQKYNKDAAVAILAVQCLDDVPDVRIFNPDEAMYILMTGYVEVLAACVECEWSSPATGKLIPPFRAMFAQEKTDGLPRCEDCHYCRQSRKSHIFTFSPTKPGRGI